MSRYAIGLGGNLGGRRSFLTAALAALASLGRIRKVSSLYETDPVGPPQPRYLNAAVELETSLAPRELLEHLLAIERLLGRERRERWGPRTIDLDLLVWDGPEIDEPGLTLPHPRCLERTFVLAPLIEVWEEPSLRARLEALGGPPAAVRWDADLDPLDAIAAGMRARIEPGPVREARVVERSSPALETAFGELRIAAVAVRDDAHLILVGERRCKVL